MKPLCISSAARWNEYVVSTLSHLMNGLLIFLIVARSPNEIRIYKRVLLLNCAVDLLFTTACLIVGMVTIDYGRKMLVC